MHRQCGCLSQYWGIVSALLPFEDPAQTIQKSFDNYSYPVQLVRHPDKGRHLVTPKLIEPGETLLKCHPYAAVILDKAAQTHCHACYKRLPTPSPPIKCACDFALYCSETCEAADSTRHSEECQLLRENALEKNSWAVRILIRCLTRRIQDGEFAEGLWWLQQRSGGLLPEQVQWWDPILRTLTRRYKDATGLDMRGLTRLLSIIQNNSITITQLDVDNNYDMNLDYVSLSYIYPIPGGVKSVYTRYAGTLIWGIAHPRWLEELLDG
eukprot:1188465-Prorocentrum_minimum.AAC.1